MSVALLVAAALAGAAVVALALVRPQVALLALVALDISNLNGVIAGQLGVSPYKPELGLAVLALVTILWRRRAELAWSPVLLGVAVLFAGFCVTLVSTDDPATSQALLFSRGRDLFYVVVVYALMLTTGAVANVAKAAVLVLAGLAGVTVLHEFVLHNSGDLFGLSRVPLVQEGGAYTPRHAGTSSDVNFWARLLILVAPLALSLWAAAEGRLRRLLWAGCALALLAGVYLTQSRGGFIALFVAVIGWLWLAGGRYRKSLLLVPVAVAILIPITGIGSRLGTLSNSTSDLSLVTRKRLQLDALHMFLDSPVTGHGIGSYVAIFPRYDRLADYYQPVDIVVAAHNLYLEQAADGGVFLLLAWGIFVGSMLFAALRAHTLAARAGDLPTSRLAIGVIAGVVGWLIASVFLHLSDFRALLVVGAIAAGLDVRARRLDVGPPPVRAKRPLGRARLVAVATVAGVSLAGGVLALTTGQTTYRNAATLAVVPAATGASGSAAYQLDVISRGVIVPTLATVLGSSISPADLTSTTGDPPGGVTLTVSPSTLGGALLVTVTAPAADAADRLGVTAVTLAKSRVEGLATTYRLSGDMAGVQTEPPVRRWLALPFALSLTISLLVLLRARAQRRHDHDEPEPKRTAAQPAKSDRVSVPS